MENNHENKPVYLQAKDDILDLIVSGNYKIGDLIPSVREMSRSLHYSKISIQNAIKLLALEGVLESLPRKGCHLKALIPQVLTPDGLNLVHNEIANLEYNIPGIKKIRIGVLAEMSGFGSCWKEIFLRYMSRNSGIYIELVDINDPSEYQISNEIDILHIPGERLAHFISRNLVFDIEGNNEKLDINENDFFSGSIKACYHDGKLWGTPSSLGINCFFYNSAYSELIQPLRKNMQIMEYLEMSKRISIDLPANVALHTNSPTFFLQELLIAENSSTLKEIILGKTLKEQEEILETFAPYLRNTRIFYQPATIEQRSGERIQDFLCERTALTQGNSSWLYTCDYQKPFLWGILPLPQSSQGHGGCFMHVISNYTLFPIECIEILHYLTSFEVQTFFAENGRFIPHRQASAHLKIPGFTHESLSSLNTAIDNAEIFKVPDPYYYEYLNLIFLPELLLWQNKTYNPEMFWNNLQKKTNYYYRAKQIQEKGRL